MYYVYILQSTQDQSYYVGSTADLPKRLETHNKGLVRSTSRNRPHTLMWYCAFRRKKQAIDFEKYLKHGSGFAFTRKRLV